MKEFDKELISGSVLRSVVKLALPGVFLSLANGVPGFVSQMLVGHYLNHDANAAIGVAWQLFLVMLVLISSLFNGMAVLVARYSGQQDREALSIVAYQTFLASLLILVFLVGPLGYVLAPALLNLMNTSAHVQAYALPYVRIMFTCSPAMFLMFMLSQAMQASGDMKTPLILSILNTVLNVGFSAVLVTGAGPFPQLGASGAAVGSCLAPVVGVLISLALIFNKKMIIQVPKKLTLVPDWQVLASIARIGVPTGIQAVLLNFGGAVLISKIGSLPDGAAAQAAYVICYSQLFNFVSFAAFGLRNAAATVMGQNIGAGKTERGVAGVRVAVGIGMLWGAAWGVVYWLFPYALLNIFDAANEPVLGYGMSLLKFLAFSGVFLAGSLAFTGGLQGAGDTKMPMYIAFLTQIVILLGLCEIFQWMTLLTGPAIWSAILVSHGSRFLLTFITFQRGRWKRIKLNIQQSSL